MVMFKFAKANRFEELKAGDCFVTSGKSAFVKVPAGLRNGISINAWNINECCFACFMESDIVTQINIKNVDIECEV